MSLTLRVQVWPTLGLKAGSTLVHGDRLQKVENEADIIFIIILQNVENNNIIRRY